MRCHFILVNPARGENVGFAARALKTMGFISMRIVGEAIQHSKPARKTGYGAHDILDETTVHGSLSSALMDLDLTIGTTSKQRIKRYDYHTPGQISILLQSKLDSLSEVGLLFGSEENGLTTAELEHCDLLSTIPLAGSYPSLNLAQSVLIYAWELRKAEIPHTEESAGNSKLQGLFKQEVSGLLDQLDLAEKPLVHQRIMDRLMLLNSDDTALAMTLLARLSRNLEG